jgi:hypothetical protein
MKLPSDVPRKAETSDEIVMNVPGQIRPGERRFEEPQLRLADD